MNILKNITTHAYATSPFYIGLSEEYAEIVQDSFETLPIVTKQEILTSRLPLQSMDYMHGSLSEDLINMYTSGSTGQCMEILWNRYDFDRSLVPLWIYRKKYYGISPKDKMCYFYTVNEPGREDTAYFINGNALAFSKCALDEERLVQIYDKILEYEPVWMILQPSMAAILIEIARKNGLSPIGSLKYIEFTGEMLSDTLRSEVKDFFGCSIANQYGCQEVNTIAYECPQGNLHCNASVVKTEVVEDGQSVYETEGDVVITSLCNKATPFIRYNLGDRAILHKNCNCACGNKGDIIELTSGRNNDWILNEDGTKVNAYIFARAVECINYEFDNAVKQFQIIQTDYDAFTVRLALDDMSVADEIEEVFAEYVLQPSLQYAEYNFEFFRFLLPDGRSGKLKYFINEIG